MGTPEAEAQQLNPESLTTNKALAGWLHDLANVALQQTIRSCGKHRGRKRANKHRKLFCASVQKRWKEVRVFLSHPLQRTLGQDRQAPPVLQLNSWHTIQDKLALSHYHFPATANTKDKEQRRFLGVSTASKQTDQMSHCNVLLGREANESVTKSCPGNGQSWKPFCTVPGNLQATPE